MMADNSGGLKPFTQQPFSGNDPALERVYPEEWMMPLRASIVQALVSSGDVEAAPWQKMLQLMYHGASTAKPLERGAINNKFFLSTSPAGAKHAASHATKRYGGDPAIYQMLVDPSQVDKSYLWAIPNRITRANVVSKPSALQLINDSGQLEKFCYGGLSSLR